MNKMKKTILYLLVLIFLIGLGWGGYTLIQKLTNQELERLAQESSTQEEPSLDLDKREFEISGQPKAAQEAGFYLAAEKESIKTGENFKLQIWVNGQDQVVDGAEFLIQFNPELVKIDESQLGSFFSLYPFKKVDQEQGEIRVIALQDIEEDKVLGKELVAEFLVTGLNKGEVEFAFDLAKTHIACCAGRELLKEAAPLTIKID